VQDVKTLLHNDQARQQLAAVAAKHMNPERMMRVVANAIRTTPKLQEAEPLSFLGALMQCAALGLEPNSSMGHAYLVPFKNNRKGVTEVQTIIGYKGLKALAWRSGSIDTMHADVVYSDDEEWSYGYGTDTHLRHKPGPQQGEKTHAYCHVKLKDGGQAFVVLPWSHVLRVRDGSQNWKTAVKFNKTADSPWSTHEDVMAAKTAVRYLFQRGDVPMSVEMADAMDIDHDEGARVDYASFAMNPDAGPIIEGDAEEEPAQDVVEGEAEDPPKKAEPKEGRAEEGRGQEGRAEEGRGQEGRAPAGRRQGPRTTRSSRLPSASWTTCSTAPSMAFSPCGKRN
jgi:recombination protein RecT